MAGAGIKGGQVIGASDKQAAEVVDRPISPRDMAATILNTLGVDYKKVLHTPLGRPVPLVDGGTYRLPQWVGMGNALYLIQTGARIDAHEAHRMGLLQEVVPDDALMDRARELAEVMVAVPESGLVGDTESVLRGLGRRYEDGLAVEMAIGGSTEMSAEALARFSEGRYDSKTGGAV